MKPSLNLFRSSNGSLCFRASNPTRRRRHARRPHRTIKRLPKRESIHPTPHVILVRTGGLEPPRAISPLDPKSSASANSATSANFIKHLNCNGLCQIDICPIFLYWPICDQNATTRFMNLIFCAPFSKSTSHYTHPHN